MKLLIYISAFLWFIPLVAQVGCTNCTVSQLESLYNTEWTRAVSRYTTDSETIPEPPNTQRRYYDTRVIDAAFTMFQVTGNTTYLDQWVWYIDRCIALMSDFPPTGGNWYGSSVINPYNDNQAYLDWPTDQPQDGTYNVAQLYDGHGWRNIMKQLYVLGKVATAVHALEYSTGRTYLNIYNQYRAFFEFNFWEKWEYRRWYGDSSGPMRGNTHMSSHMAAQMAYWLAKMYEVEGNAAKVNELLSWVDAWLFDVSQKSSYASGYGMIDQLREDTNGYIWNATFGTMTSATDIGHSNAEVSTLIDLYQDNYQGLNWSFTNIQKLIQRMDWLFDQCTDQVNFDDIAYYLNGNAGATVRILSYGWVRLGRFDVGIQLRMEQYDNARNQASYVKNLHIAHLAYNKTILDGNQVAYSEFAPPIPPPPVAIIGNRLKVKKSIPVITN